MFDYGVDHFNRKWDNLAPGGAVETEDFVPLPPDKPTYVSPTNGASNQPTTLTLKCTPARGRKYDIYLGTDPNPTTPLVTGVELGPSESSKDYVTYAITMPLQEGNAGRLEGRVEDDGRPTRQRSDLVVRHHRRDDADVGCRRCQRLRGQRACDSGQVVARRGLDCSGRFPAVQSECRRSQGDDA